MPKPANPIPPGFHSLTPHISVKSGPAGGAAAFIEFVKRAFDAVEMNRMAGPGGKIMHATVRIGDSMLMLADDFAAEFGMPPLAEGRTPFVINLYVPDADATWKKAVDAGAKVMMPLSDQFWGDRYGHIGDPFGFIWAISTHKEDLTPEEIKERQEKAFSSGHPS